MIRVLIAEDSPVQRQFLSFLLERLGDFKVIGVASDGAEAVTQTKSLRPDIILMDCYMPNMDGLQATQQIMEHCPTPIVLASADLAPREAEITFDAMRFGALAVVAKPSGFDTPGHEKMTDDMLRTLRLMSEVKVIGRRVHKLGAAQPAKRQVAAPGVVDLIAIGGSTGAPGVIADILTPLVARRTSPILIVQHLTEGFVSRFAEWLNSKTDLTVGLGMEHTVVKPGHVYLAPDGLQMGISPSGHIRLEDAPAEDGFRPSATYLLRSVAQSYADRGMGILLTGMGCDGASGLLAMRHVGAHTVAQSKETCVVYGMPRAAVQLAATKEILSPKLIAELIASSRSKPEESASGRPSKTSVA